MVSLRNLPHIIVLINMHLHMQMGGGRLRKRVKQNGYVDMTIKVTGLDFCHLKKN